MKRAAAVFRQELAHTLSRPLFLFLVVLLLLLSFGLSRGNVSIASGDSTVGGTKAWITSEFAFAFVLSTMVGALYAFFLAIASGLAVVQDDEWKISELLHATPLTPREYAWAKFLAVGAGFGIALGLHLLFAMVWNQLVPNPHTAEIRGPFELANYLRPALVFAAPALVFYAGVAFYLGERTRRPLLVFLFPLAVFLLSVFFLWEWSPAWLDPRLNRALMLIDPSGFRWLNETWLRLDRGARFYNTARIPLDAGFLASRAVFAGIGLAGVWLAQRGLARRLGGGAGGASAGGASAASGGEAAASAGGGQPPLPLLPRPLPLASLGMRTRPPGLWAGSLPVLRAELHNLFASPGVYIFGVLILLQTILDSSVALGPFDTEVLVTPGYLAAATLRYLSVLLCPLLMFYTVESIERDRSTGLAAMSLAAPTSTPSLLLGKGAANGVLAAAVVAITFAGCAVVLLIQRTVPLAMGPFLAVWGLLMVPTLVLWTAFVIAVQTLFASRAVTYGVCLAALAATGYRSIVGKINWVGNWPLWNAVRWSDLGAFEIDRKALVLSRLGALGLAACFAAVAVYASRRREPDAIGTLHRLQPRALARQAWRLAPFAAVPLVAGSLLWVAVLDGFEGDATKKRQKDYWKQNLGTWKESPIPALEAVDLDVTLEPERRWFHTRGTYRVWNDRAADLPRFAMTAGPHWRNVAWRLDGRPYKPEDRTGLYVIAPPRPLGPGGRLAVGFECEGVLPEGISKNGGQVREFILPSGVVLTSFTPAFAPVLGYVEEIGVDKDNRYEPRVYPPDFYLGKTDAAFGSNSAFTTRIKINAPAAYTINSVGVLESDQTAAGRRTVVWRSDQPVRFFNIVAGRWQVKRGDGTAVYYDRRHAYNIAAMSRALDAARRYYSQWFYPYPWRELKVSEFAAHSFYAQGFPTDISFSEGIGFLTKSDVSTDAVFVVTAHESAHQWWGNLIIPGKGPGGDLLSEGMSHFSTLLLVEQVQGLAARIEFAKRLEERYGRNRHPDAEHPLVEIDGSRAGDTTVTYDKGGWVFWMLLGHLGRDRTLAGLRRFIADWKDSSDHPVLQDFTAAMRPFAADPAAYDAFVRQWFMQVVVPEYQLRDARKRRVAGGGGGSSAGGPSAGGRSAGGRSGNGGAGGAEWADWEVTVAVKNAGSGSMPVEIAAARGRRFSAVGKPEPAYRDVRATVVLGAGEERQVSLRCPFEPDTVLVDPDALVLQLRRKSAAAKL
ncbi:MAG TPA: M1 family aminopeptidase [Thermoanaerobaculia bacterium]|nr:M1 family aminopeptidase [Thermoanaerobaculia bacterium]